MDIPNSIPFEAVILTIEVVILNEVKDPCIFVFVLSGSGKAHLFSLIPI
jgi:hypothetical protein